jgi:spore coat polysaccharide biosynthesis protein SpsF (cytidylyltransferase family)
MKKISAVIQARLNSKRLKKKMLLPILGKPMIFYLIERLKTLNGIDEIVLSTSTSEINYELIEYVKSLGIKTFYDDDVNEDDLCTRLYKTCKRFKCDAILKINGDCPIPEINILKRILKIFEHNQEVDYISNKNNDHCPLGYSAEIISFKSLKWCFKNLKNCNDREFVAKWIGEDRKHFKKIFIKSKVNLKYTKHLMIDTLEDFRVVEEIFSKLYKKKKYFNMRDIEYYFKRALKF